MVVKQGPLWSLVHHRHKWNRETCTRGEEIKWGRS